MAGSNIFFLLQKLEKEALLRSDNVGIDYVRKLNEGLNNPTINRTNIKKYWTLIESLKWTGEVYLLLCQITLMIKSYLI